ncbi:MAG: hypothetical protein V7K49_12095 [Nostoc sp.]
MNTSFFKAFVLCTSAPDYANYEVHDRFRIPQRFCVKKPMENASASLTILNR